MSGLRILRFQKGIPVPCQNYVIYISLSTH